MLAERSVRRLSVRAPDDALARRGAFLVEDALRTASLPGDGGGLLLVRRLRLPPFSVGASAQQVALALEAQCRAVVVVDGMTADDSALAGAPAVRFVDALSAHMALTRQILGGHQSRAWCWPLMVKGYRAALGTGPALRAVSLSLATLPEAPTALPRWLAQVVAKAAGVTIALLTALEAEDVQCLQQACSGALTQHVGAMPAQWRAALDLSASLFGREDDRHRWLASVATLCGAEAVSDGDPLRSHEAQRLSQHSVHEPTPQSRHADDVDSERSQDGEQAAPSAQEPVRDAPHEVGPQRAMEVGEANESSRNAASVPGRTAAPTTTTTTTKPVALQREGLAVRSTAGFAETAGGRATVDAHVLQMDSALEAATAAGGLLFLVPLLAQLGLPEALADDPARGDLPQRIFAILLRRLSIADEDPAWQLCEGRLLSDVGADLDAAHWLAACRRHLRLKLNIGLHSLVHRPATMLITPTHVDVRLPIEVVDLRIRRAGLDIDPGWVPWLGRVLRFHYGLDRS